MEEYIALIQLMLIIVAHPRSGFFLFIVCQHNVAFDIVFWHMGLDKVTVQMHEISTVYNIHNNGCIVFRLCNHNGLHLIRTKMHDSITSSIKFVESTFPSI